MIGKDFTGNEFSHLTHGHDINFFTKKIVCR